MLSFWQDIVTGDKNEPTQSNRRRPACWHQMPMVAKKELMMNMNEHRKKKMLELKKHLDTGGKIGFLEDGEPYAKCSPCLNNSERYGCFMCHRAYMAKRGRVFGPTCHP